MKLIFQNLTKETTKLNSPLIPLTKKDIKTNRVRFNNYIFYVLFLTGLLLLMSTQVSQAIDNEITRRTMSGLKGINITVEELQPSILKYAQKTGLTREQIQKDVEIKLKSTGIKIFALSEWLNAPGRPMLYINVNTHEFDKYLYAYDIKLEFRQVVFLEANPSIKTMAVCWSTNMTGIANIGTLNSIRSNIGKMTDIFIEAYRSANTEKRD
jgi:hypothetical protein